MAVRKFCLSFGIGKDKEVKLVEEVKNYFDSMLNEFLFNEVTTPISNSNKGFSSDDGINEEE
jgi:hypothetical protein